MSADGPFFVLARKFSKAFPSAAVKLKPRIDKSTSPLMMPKRIRCSRMFCRSRCLSPTGSSTNMQQNSRERFAKQPQRDKSFDRTGVSMERLSSDDFISWTMPSAPVGAAQSAIQPRLAHLRLDSQCNDRCNRQHMCKVRNIQKKEMNHP